MREAAEGSERLTNELLVGERTVHLGGVEEGDTTLDRRADERDHLLPVGGRAESEAHAHAAEAERGDFEPASTELPLLHRCSCVIVKGVAPAKHFFGVGIDTC